MRMPSGMGTSWSFTALLHIRAPRLIIGSDDLVFETQFHCQFAGPRLFGYPGVGAALDNETLAANRLYDAAEAV